MGELPLFKKKYARNFSTFPFEKNNILVFMYNKCPKYSAYMPKLCYAYCTAFTDTCTSKFSTLPF